MADHTFHPSVVDKVGTSLSWGLKVLATTGETVEDLHLAHAAQLFNLNINVIVVS
jgi:hypothetical protein